MNFKLSVLSAVMAVATAGSSGDHASPVIPQLIRNLIASDPHRFTSETARQQFLNGETDDIHATDLYLGTQTTFGKGGCEEAAKVKEPGIGCAVFSLDGDDKELVLHEDTRLGGFLTIGEASLELKYKTARNYEYHWYINETFQLEADQSWTIEIGEEGGEPITIQKDWNEALVTLHVKKTSMWPETRLFWYRLGGYHQLADSDRYMWCAMIAEPKC
eukprot:Clim_evm4s100 gene=Clim_evmTU4s100